MAIKREEAIILRTQPFRSSSLIVTTFTRYSGKIKGIAKGVRLERELRGSLYELFTHVEIIYYEKTRSDLNLISEASILESFDNLQSQFEAVCYASYFSELVDLLCEINDPHENILDLLLFSYRYLNSIPGERLARIFEVQLLKEIGWLPHLDSCSHCSAQELGRGAFSPREGGLICDRCSFDNPETIAMTPEAISTMRYYVSHAPEESIRSNVTHETQKILGNVMNRFLMERSDRQLKSQRFIQNVLRSGMST